MSERKSPFNVDHRIVFARLCHPDGQPFFGCPRTLCYRALAELRQIGYEIKIGMEIEFMVFKSAESMEPIEYNNDSNLHSLVNNIDDFDMIYKKLLAHDIHIEAIHKECGFGQFEMVIKYGETLKILDDYYIAKEIIA